MICRFCCCALQNRTIPNNTCFHTLALKVCHRRKRSSFVLALFGASNLPFQAARLRSHSKQHQSWPFQPSADQSAEGQIWRSASRVVRHQWFHKFVENLRQEFTDAESPESKNTTCSSRTGGQKFETASHRRTSKSLLQECLRFMELLVP